MATCREGDLRQGCNLICAGYIAGSNHEKRGTPVHFLLLAVAVSVGMVGSPQAQNGARTVVTRGAEQVDFVPGEIIVMFHDPALVAQSIARLDAGADIAFERMLFDSDTLRIALFAVPEGREAEFVTRIGAQDNVSSAELNAIGSFN